MVSYPDLSSLNNGSGIAGLMKLPNSSYPYFWLWIMAGLWIIIFLSMYFLERDKTGKGKILSSMSVSSLAIIFLSAIGTVLGIITVDIMIYILVFGFLIWVIWFLASKG